MEDYDRWKGVRPLSPYATSTYDTIWTVALTLRKAMDQTPENKLEPLLEQFTYHNGKETTELFLGILQGLRFLGISVGYFTRNFEYEINNL